MSYAVYLMSCIYVLYLVSFNHTITYDQASPMQIAVKKVQNKSNVIFYPFNVFISSYHRIHRIWNAVTMTKYQWPASPKPVIMRVHSAVSDEIPTKDPVSDSVQAFPLFVY